MELSLNHQLGLVCVILLFPALCSCNEYFTNSRASYYNTPDGLGNPRGACGFEEYGRTINNGSVAAVSGLWRNGAGCGTCYWVLPFPFFSLINILLFLTILSKTRLHHHH
ncbi:hypothetical protein AAZV13_17G135100 [Glycine max]